MILLTLIDAPSEGEEYYNERAIKGIMEILTQGLDIGLSVSKLRIQPLPERLKSPIRGTESVEKRLASEQKSSFSGEKPENSLDTPSDEA